MSATWLQPRPLGAMFDLPRIGSFEELRDVFTDWNGLPLNVAYADRSGTIGWQLIGSAPSRSGAGAVPQPGWDPATAWDPDPVPFDAMPNATDPGAGYIATANNLPAADAGWLGVDFLDGYRVSRIVEALAGRDDWDVERTLEFHLDRKVDKCIVEWR